MDAVLAEGKSRGCVAAWLGTDTDNTAAHACFASVAMPGESKPFLLFDWDLDR